VVEHETYTGKIRNSITILVRKPEQKRSLGRSRHTWENTKMDIKVVGWEVVDWIYKTQNRLL
jgi:hypothetical protein